MGTAYRYTEADAETGGLGSKYALDPARHGLRVGLGLPETHGFTPSVGARYRRAPVRDEYWLMTARVVRRIGRCSVFVGGRDLLDEEYEEIPGVPTAPRYVEVGFEVDL